MARIKVFLYRKTSGPCEKTWDGVWEYGKMGVGVRVHEGKPLLPGEVLQYGSEFFRVEAGDTASNEYTAKRCLSWTNTTKITKYEEVA